MGIRKTLITNIVDDFKEKLTIAEGYSVEPVRIFDVLMDPTKVNQFPSLAIGMYIDLIDEEGNRQMRRFPQIIVYGYTNSADQMFDLADDVEHFLYHNDSDFTYKAQVQPVEGSGVNFRYSGASNSVGVFTFDLLFGIFYTQEMT